MELHKIDVGNVSAGVNSVHQLALTFEVAFLIVMPNIWRTLFTPAKKRLKISI